MRIKKQKIPYIILFVIGVAFIIYGMANIGGEEPQVDELTELSVEEPEVVEPEIVVEPVPLGINVEVKPNETLSGLFQSQGVDIVETALAVEQINEVYDLRKLRAGQELDLELEDNKEDSAVKHLKKLSFQPSISEIVHLEVSEAGEYKAFVEKVALDEVYIKAQGEIRSSFYESLVNAGVTDNVTLQLIAALSFVVDFQRDIKAGNEFEILYQAYMKDGKIVKGKIPAYAKLKLNREEIEIFVIQNKDGSLGYYDAKGVNVKKGLLRTPVNGARISSGFGNRRHPILGYTKLHAGVDFAAPTGTPVYAAGDGVIQRMNRFGSFGNYVKIKHNKTYSTAYAHLSRFAKGLRAGSRVKQGQVIAYVGTTGRSTGPHLHYEVIKNGKKINPQNAKFNIVKKLTGNSLAAFNKRKAVIEEQLKIAKTRAEIESGDVANSAAPANKP